MQNEEGEASAVGDEAAAKSSEEPSAEAEENGERGEEETDESAERREIVKMSDPREPTEDERREHSLARLPFAPPLCTRTRSGSRSSQIQRTGRGLTRVTF